MYICAHPCQCAQEDLEFENDEWVTPPGGRELAINPDAVCVRARVRARFLVRLSPLFHRTGFRAMGGQPQRHGAYKCF